MTYLLVGIQRITLNASCMTISGGRTMPFLSLHRGHGTAYHLPSKLFHPGFTKRCMAPHFHAWCHTPTRGTALLPSSGQDWKKTSFFYIF